MISGILPLLPAPNTAETLVHWARTIKFTLAIKRLTYTGSHVSLV